MVDPETSLFVVSWEDEDDVIESTEVRGAEAALAWGRERAEVVLIRLGHTWETYFSAGDRPEESLPAWPSQASPPEGWFTPRPDGF
jgi:hypothetical protein